MNYSISVLGDFIRHAWLKQHRSFTLETVMSHPDKGDFLAEARRTGFRTYLYFVCTDSSEINVERVANRVRDGGHPVDPGKIRARYERSLMLFPAALKNSDRAYLFDNSAISSPLRLIAEFESGTLKKAVAELPLWLRRILPRVS